VTEKFLHCGKKRPFPRNVGIRAEKKARSSFLDMANLNS